MPLDAICMQTVVRETAAQIENTRIEKIQQPASIRIPHRKYNTPAPSCQEGSPESCHAGRCRPSAGRHLRGNQGRLPAAPLRRETRKHTLEGNELLKNKAHNDTFTNKASLQSKEALFAL